MAKRPKKYFSCGHRGKGQYCHRCAQGEALRSEIGEVVESKDALKALEQAAQRERVLTAKIADMKSPRDDASPEAWSGYQDRRNELFHELVMAKEAQDAARSVIYGSATRTAQVHQMKHLLEAGKE